MYRCQNCSRVVPAGSKAQRIIIRKPDVIHVTDHRVLGHTTEVRKTVPGQIAKELLACSECFEGFHLGIPLSVLARRACNSPHPAGVGGPCPPGVSSPTKETEPLNLDPFGFNPFAPLVPQDVVPICNTPAKILQGTSNLSSSRADAKALAARMGQQETPKPALTIGLPYKEARKKIAEAAAKAEESRKKPKPKVKAPPLAPPKVQRPKQQVTAGVDVTSKGLNAIVVTEDQHTGQIAEYPAVTAMEGPGFSGSATKLPGGNILSTVEFDGPDKLPSDGVDSLSRSKYPAKKRSKKRGNS